MEKTNNKIFSQKINLIYEFNRNTPLFVKMANSQIEDNNVDDAVEILRAGLKTYPEHPVALLLVGKAFAMMGDYGKALEYFKKGSDIIQSDETYNYYINELEKIKKQRSLFEASRGNTFFNSSNNLQQTLNQPNLFNEKSQPKTEKDLAASIDERLEQLAEQISKVKLSASSNSISKTKDFKDILTQDNMLVSETLAKIYVAQNEYDEAIKVYEKLIKKEPSKHEHYSRKIIDIRSRLIS